MRKVYLVFAALLLIALNSCVQEECKTNSTGDVTITNKTAETLWFDVTDDEGNTNENRSVAPGASTTYTMPAGAIQIWASYTNSNNDFALIDTKELGICDNLMLDTPTEPCALFNVGTVRMTNSTGYIIYVDIRQNGELYGQTTLQADQYVEYVVWAGANVDFGMIIPGITSSWHWDQNIEITACETTTCNWTYSKFLELKSLGQETNAPVSIEFKERARKR